MTERHQNNEERMNKKRRKELDELFRRIELAKIAVESVPDVDDIRTELETTKDAEQEAFDNLPESVQGGERGQAMEASISAMDEALEKLQEVADAVVTMADDLQEAMDKIMEAQE
jgi:hypothetical protein